jgi:hypothetical protein
MSQIIPTTTELALRFEAALRLGIDPTGVGAINLRPGSDNAVLVSMATQLGNRLFAYAADRGAARSLGSSTGDDLDDYVRDIFADKRKEASVSVGTVYLQRAGTNPSPVPKGSRFGTRAQGTQQALQFEAAADISAGTAVSRVAIPIRCRTPGLVGNVALASILDILDPLPDPTWQIYVPSTNDPVLNGGPVDVIGGGGDHETDDQLKARMGQRSLDTDRQRGTRAAILAGAGKVGGVVYTTAIEPQDGTVVLYVGDASYQLPQSLAAAVRLELENWRAFGVPVLIRPYNAQLVPITLALFMARPLSNYDTAAINAAVVAEVVRYFENRPQPDEYYTEAIIAAGFRAHVEAQHSVLATPSQSVQRPADAGYGAVTALNRYFVKPESISVSILDPLHT